MLLRGSRRLTLVAGLLVLPLLVSALAIALPVHGHECAFDRDCLACRSTAAVVTEITAPPADPAAPRPAGFAGPARLDEPRAGASRAAAPRGPPSLA